MSFPFNVKQANICQTDDDIKEPETKRAKMNDFPFNISGCTAVEIKKPEPKVNLFAPLERLPLIPRDPPIEMADLLERIKVTPKELF